MNKNEKEKKISPNVSFKQFINQHSQSLFKCIQCGACTGSCPSGRRTQLRVRKIVERSIMGFSDVLTSDDLWLCTTCYTCYDRCPRDVQPTSIIKGLRNLAVKKGFMKPDHQKVASLFCNTGHIVPINDKIKQLRKKLNLSELPPTVHSYPKSLSEVQKIIDRTHFREIAKC